MDKEQTTTPGTPCPTLYDECVASLTSPASHYSKDVGDGAYGLSSLSEKTRISNHFADVIAKAAYSPQLFEDPECWSSLGLEPETSRTVVRRSTNWANRSAVKASYKMTSITSLDINKLNICIETNNWNKQLAAEAAYSFETNARYYFDARQ